MDSPRKLKLNKHSVRLLSEQELQKVSGADNSTEYWCSPTGAILCYTAGWCDQSFTGGGCTHGSPQGSCVSTGGETYSGCECE